MAFIWGITLYKYRHFYLSSSIWKTSWKTF